jgi:tetratricopeptide (TPR) repeat protein
MKRALACMAGLLIVAGMSLAQKVSKKEYDAFMAIQQATAPDARIAAVDKFVTGFADSTLKSTALFMAADAAQRKNDSPTAISYAQSALDADPKNYQAMLLISGELAKGTRENDLDKEEKLAKSEKLAHDAMEAIKTAQKPNPQLPDDQWAAYKKDMTSQADEDLGLAALARKKYPDAITHFKESIDIAANPDPATMVRLAAAYNQAGKPDDAIATTDKILALPNLNPTIKQFASSEKARAEKAKSGGK